MLGTFLLIALAIVAWYVLNRTGYGRHIYATGDDPEAARLAGINTEHILLSVYVLAGLIAAMAGWAIIGRVGAIRHTAGENANLDSITAVVIGGTSLFGGRGSIVGTRKDLIEAIQFAHEGKVRAEIHKAKLEEINEVLTNLKAGKVKGRIVIDFA